MQCNKTFIKLMQNLISTFFLNYNLNDYFNVVLVHLFLFNVNYHSIYDIYINFNLNNSRL